MNALDTVKIMAMGIIIGLLALIALNRSEKATAADAASAGKIMALSCPSKDNVILFLIDTESQHVATYVANDIQFGFAYARYYGYDLNINEADKFKRSGFSLKETEEMYNSKKNKDFNKAK